MYPGGSLRPEAPRPLDGVAAAERLSKEATEDFFTERLFGHLGLEAHPPGLPRVPRKHESILTSLLEPISPVLRKPYRVIGVSWLDAQLSQDPNAIGELQRLVQHVLPLHVPLGNSVNVVVLQLAGNSV